MDQAYRQNFNSKVVSEAKGGLGNTTQLVLPPVEFVGPPLPEHLRLERERAEQFSMGSGGSRDATLSPMSAAPAGPGPWTRRARACPYLR